MARGYPDYRYFSFPVAVNEGGTGGTSFTLYGVLLGNSSGALGVSAAGNPYEVLRVPAAGGFPAFGALDLAQAAAVTGLLPIAKGGTGQTAKAAAFDALSPTTTRGDLIVRDAANNVRLALGASGKVLISNGTDATWGDPPAGVPSKVASLNLTAQEAAIGATTWYAVPAGAGGLYRISFVAKVTRAATTASTLGGTGGFRIAYTDPDDSSAPYTPAGHVYNSDAATLQLNNYYAVYSGVIVVNAKASTWIAYLMDYSSTGATKMQYSLRAIIETLF